MNELYRLRTFLTINKFSYTHYVRRTDVTLKGKRITVPHTGNTEFDLECMNTAKIILLLRYNFYPEDITKVVIKEWCLPYPSDQGPDQPLTTDNHMQKLMTAAKDWRDAGDNCFLKERNLIKIIDEICSPNPGNQGPGQQIDNDNQPP